MFHGGNYSKGMDQMELALNEIMKGQFIYEQEKAAACLYLIPRVKYIDQCYNVSRILPMQIGPFILFLLFSPCPMPHFDLYQILKRTTKQSNSLKTEQKPDTNELVDNTQGISVLSTINFEFVQDGISIADDYVTLLKNTMVRLVNVLRNNSVVFFYLFYVPIWVIIVWIKLLYLFSWCGCYNLKQQWSFVSLHVNNYCVRYKELSTLRVRLQCVRDPRFLALVSCVSHDDASVTKTATTMQRIVKVVFYIGLPTMSAILTFISLSMNNVEAT